MSQYTLVKKKLASKSLRIISLGFKIILKVRLKMGSKGASNKRKFLLRPRNISIARNSFICQRLEQRRESTLQREIRSGCLVSRVI